MAKRKNAPGKRSFKASPRDFYRTHKAAMPSLMPHLEPGTKFVELCAGAGHLVDLLEREGHECLMACDVAPRRDDIAKRDMFTVTAEEVAEADYHITNPPWSRPLLEYVIPYTLFRLKKPAWLLFDADWKYTRSAAPFLTHVDKVVAVGRLNWVEGTPHVGYENAAWYLFTPFGDERRTITFIPRDLYHHQEPIRSVWSYRTPPPPSPLE